MEKEWHCHWHTDRDLMMKKQGNGLTTTITRTENESERELTREMFVIWHLAFQNTRSFIRGNDQFVETHRPK
jgi:hypothetical protein